MKTLYLLLLLVVIIIGVLIYQKIASVEGFADTTQVEPSFCPHNMQSYIDSKTSDTVCCDGTVADNICSGNAVCTLTPNSASNLSACSTYLREYNALKAKEHCFGSMPYYYEDYSQRPIISGCASKVNKETFAPALNAQSCRVYPTTKLNQYNGGSCENRKMVYLGKTSKFCEAVGCTNVETGGNGQNIAWVGANYMTRDGSVPVQAWCETKESVKRHIIHGYGDYYMNDASMQPKTGQELADALAKVDAGTYPGMCPTSAPYTPKTIPLEKLQEMFNKAGCTRVLTEAGQVEWWRSKGGSIENIQNDMNAYGSLTKGCTGSKGQHEFCSPGKCADPLILYLRIQDRGRGMLGISQIVVKNKQGINIAKDSKKFWYSTEYDTTNYPNYYKKVVDGNEKARHYPDIYHSIETEQPYLIFEFNTPTTLSNIASITVYGREGCCPERNANKIITLYKATPSGGASAENIVWSSPVTNDNVMQTFTVS